MKIKVVLAAIAVSDIEHSIPWYEGLFGRPCDERPMPEVAEWYLLGRAGIQLVQDGERAGKSTPPGSGPFRLVRLPDPNGNLITFAEDTR